MLYINLESDSIFYLGIGFVVMLLGANPSTDQMIANRIGQSEVIIARRSHISILQESSITKSTRNNANNLIIALYSSQVYQSILALSTLFHQIRIEMTKSNSGICINRQSVGAPIDAHTSGFSCLLKHFTVLLNISDHKTPLPTYKINKLIRLCHSRKNSLFLTAKALYSAVLNVCNSIR